MQTSPQSPNVWPGYVAAVAGLAITLLLVIAILGGDLFLVSQAVRQELRLADGEGEGDPPIESALAAASPEVVDAPSPVPMAPRRDGAMPSAAALSTRANPESDPAPTRSTPTPSGRIVVTFDEDAHVLDDEVRASLRTALSSLHPDRRLLLTARVFGDASGTARRAAYIRIMSLRNALLDLGIAANRIQYALNDADTPSGSSAAEPAARTVVIEAAPSAIEGEAHAR